MRARLLSSGIVAILVVGAGAVLQTRVGPEGSPPPEPVSAETGAWFCPHGGLWKTWVTVGNPGVETATVRLSTFGSEGMAALEAFELAGGEQRYVPVPTPNAGAGTMVEFFGSEVAAGWVSEGGGGVAAESCRGSAGRSWYVADGITELTSGGSERRSWLIVMNPFAVDAAFDVTLLTAEGAPTRVGELRGYVLKAHRSVAFNLNRFLLGEISVAAAVNATLGSVSVSQLGSTEGVGIRAVTAVPHPARRWVFPSALGADDSALVVADPREESAAFSVRQQGPEEQRPVEALTEESLRGLSVQTYEISSEPGPSGIVVEANGEIPVVAARRTAGRKGDVGGTSGASSVASSWVVPPTVPPEGGGQQRLLIENPGLQDITVHVRLFGDADADLGTIQVPAGRTVAVGLDEPSDGAPAWVSVESEDGTFVAGSASLSLEGAAYALSIGLPSGAERVDSPES